jgi:hypothetical protein
MSRDYALEYQRRDKAKLKRHWERSSWKPEQRAANTRNRRARLAIARWAEEINR